MALLIETIKDKYAMQSSMVYGRRIGLGRSPNGGLYEMLAGPVDMMSGIEDITTTAATSALPHGVTAVLTSGSSQLGQYSLQSPIPGVRKTLALISTSTGSQQFALTNATVFSGSGSTGATVINLRYPGAVVQLIGLSTSQWLQTNYASSVNTNVLFSTSTG